MIHIPTRYEKMTDSERHLSDLLGPAFWVEDNAVGFVNNRTQEMTDAALSGARDRLKAAGYRVRTSRFEGFAYRLKVMG